MSGATDAGDGSGRTKELTPRESRKHLAETGRYEELLRQLAAIPWTMIDVEETWGLVLRAIEVRGSGRTPDRLADDVLEQVGAVHELFVGANTFHRRAPRISQHDHALTDQGARGLLAGCAREAHSHAGGTARHTVADLITSQAAVTRLRQLARRGKLKNDRAERATKRPARRNANPDPVSIRQPGPACPNGKVVERNDGPRTNGVQDDARDHVADVRLGSRTSVGRARTEAGPSRRDVHRPGDAGPEDDALRPPDLGDPGSRSTLPGGKRVHRSLHVGTDLQLVRRARHLLGRYRQRQRWPEEIATYVRLAGSVAALVRRLASR